MSLDRERSSLAVPPAIEDHIQGAINATVVLVPYRDYQVELDVCQFLQDLAGKVHLARINQDLASGLKSGVTTTPTLFINGDRLSIAETLSS